MLDLEVWVSRLNALLNNIKDEEDGLLRQLNTQTVPRSNTIKHLLQELHDYGLSHFSYFYEAFTKKTIDGKDASARAENLEKDKEYSYATVFNWITTQISNDLSIILRAWDQRRDNQNYRVALEKADKFAQLALCPAIKCGYIPDGTSVLCYFQKSYRVRLMPYANVVLVGVPFSALEVPRDFLAIPHEVAHFVFRHGTLANKGAEQPYKSDNESIASSLKWAFRKNDEYLQHWVEEMFADMYGCVIVGPVIALDFQDLQMDDRLEEFADTTIDYEDPPPMLRPDTYSKVLAKSTDSQRPRLAQFLHHRWKLYRGDLWSDYYDHYLKDKNPPNGNELSLKIAKNETTQTNGAQNGNAGIRNENNSADSVNTILINNLREDSTNLSGNPFDAMITKIWDEFISNIWNQVKDSKSECRNLLYLAGDVTNKEGEEAFLSTLLAEKTVQDFPDDEEKRKELDTELNKLYETFKAELDDLVTKIEIASLKEATPRGLATSDKDRDNKWKAWKNRWEKRNVVKKPTANGNGRLPSVRESISKNEYDTRTRRPEKKWGWVDLAYANGWVTRGPEPNPTGT